MNYQQKRWVNDYNSGFDQEKMVCYQQKTDSDFGGWGQWELIQWFPGGFHSYFASSAVPRFLFIWIMQVLTASLLPSPLGGHISVSITTSFNGEDICRVELPGGTLADLEKALCDPHGPMFGSYPWSRLLFYTENEPSRSLNPNLQIDAFHSLVIKRGDVEAFLDKFPHVGKFLEAMASNMFDPRSPNFDINWTAAQRPAVNAEHFVQEFLSGLPAHADSGLHFVQIFGKLTALGEDWRMLDLALMQNFDPGTAAVPALCFPTLAGVGSCFSHLDDLGSNPHHIPRHPTTQDEWLWQCQCRFLPWLESHWWWLSQQLRPFVDQFPPVKSLGSQCQLERCCAHIADTGLEPRRRHIIFAGSPQQNSAGALWVRITQTPRGLSDGSPSAAFVLLQSCRSPRAYQSGLCQDACRVACLQA